MFIGHIYTSRGGELWTGGVLSADIVGDVVWKGVARFFFEEGVRVIGRVRVYDYRLKDFIECEGEALLVYCQLWS